MEANRSIGGRHKITHSWIQRPLILLVVFIHTEITATAPFTEGCNQMSYFCTVFPPGLAGPHDHGGPPHSNRKETTKQTNEHDYVTFPFCPGWLDGEWMWRLLNLRFQEATAAGLLEFHFLRSRSADDSYHTVRQKTPRGPTSTATHIERGVWHGIAYWMRSM